MIRFTWLQARAQTSVAMAVLVVAAILTAITGPHLVHLYDTAVATCQANNDCGPVTSAFQSTDHWLQAPLPQVLLVLPALVGIFWGAPLVAHELETGTFRLAWTQSVTRKRWLAVKIGVTGLASVILAGLFTLIITWWFSPIDQVNMNRLTPAMFGERGITPIGYTAFAFTLGVTAGVLIRRTLPAMATTLVVFVGTRLAISYGVRPNLMAPLHANSPLQMAVGNGAAPLPGAGAVKPGDWVLSDQVINAAGQVIGQNGGIGPNGSIAFASSDSGVSLVGVGACPNKFPGSALAARSGGQQSTSFSAAAQECIDKLGIRDLITYQPLSRYWPLQWYETLIFTGLAVVLAGFCFWWVRRSLT